MKTNKLIISIIICQLAGILGSLFTTPKIGTWYALLEKPGFSPPNWVFGPVWVFLFFLMGLSLYLVWSKGAKGSLYIFSFQLTLNILWSFLFFGLQSPFYAFMGIIALWLAIFLTIILFYKISKASAYLLIPYLLWVSFAVFLNLFIWQLN